MGGAVSTGQDNDDLIDNLLQADYIRTPIVERVFRGVDRADYFLPDARGNAYKDLAWKSDHLHLSAPCIYSEVMEGLTLSAGLSFLNLGSGTGYLSTMVGLILGSNGVNHGVEIHEDVIQYATKKLEDFKRYSGAVDEFDFCEPKFIQGNCLCLTTDRQYDRVYCGAACPEHYESYMKNLLRIGGVLIMPLNDHLMRIKRTSDVTWEGQSLLPVSFATLIHPVQEKQEIVELLDVAPLSLQSLSRAVIRSILRKNIELENPNLRKRTPPVKKPKRKDRALRRLVVPIFDDSGDDPFSSDDEQRQLGNNRRTTDNIFDIVMDHLGYRVRQRGNRPNQEEERPAEERNGNNEDNEDAAAMEVELSAGEDVPRELNEARAIVDNPSGSNVREDNNHRRDESTAEEQNESPQREERPEEVINTINTVEGVFVDVLQEMRRVEDAVPEEREVNNEIEQVFVNVLHELERERSHVQNQVEEQLQVEENGASNEERPEEVRETNETDNNRVDVEGNEVAISPNEEQQSNSSRKREKFDSGLGEEIVEKDNNNFQDSSENESMDVDSSSSNDGMDGKRNKRGSRNNPEVRGSAKWRRICLSTRRIDSYSSSTSDSETVQEEPNTSGNHRKTVPSPYTKLMREKIQELPLPPILKNYLNFYREF